MKIFNTKEIKNIDALTVRYEGITSLELMERAALAAADEIMARWTQKIPVIIFAGKGNNGGDGLAIARILTKFGYDVTTYLFNPSGKLSKDCQKNKEALKETDNAKLIEVNKSLDMPSLDGDILVIMILTYLHNSKLLPLVFVFQLQSYYLHSFEIIVQLHHDF